MFAFVRYILALLVAYSLGFLSGMNYHGQDKSEALQEHLTEGVQRSKELIDSVK